MKKEEWKEEKKKDGRNSADKKQKEKNNGWPRGADLTLIILVSTRLQVSTRSSFSEAPPQPLTCAGGYYSSGGYLSRGRNGNVWACRCR